MSPQGRERGRARPERLLHEPDLTWADAHGEAASGFFRPRL